MNGIMAFNKAKKYIQESLTGAGAIQGQPGENGKDGIGILNIEKTSTDGLVDTYTITYSDYSTFTFNVTNGKSDDKNVDLSNYVTKEELSELLSKIDYSELENNPIVTVGSIDTLTDLTRLETGIYKIIGAYTLGKYVSETPSVLGEVSSIVTILKGENFIIAYTPTVQLLAMMSDDIVQEVKVAQFVTSDFVDMQISNAIDNINIQKGESAYELAVKNGFTGSEEEWLESLKGEQGDDGRSIKSITKDDNDDIIVAFTDNTTENIGQLSVDISSDFLTSDGFGNLRYYNGHFQYYDKNTSTWVDILLQENPNVPDLNPSNTELYGFIIDQNESDPEHMITYIEDNEHYNSAYMDYDKDVFNYGDWKDAFFMNIKPCMLKYNGTVAYFLNPNDYSKKEDGTFSDIENELYDGNIMIQFPKVYWKIVDNGDNTANIYISNKKLDEDFHCWSHIDNNGNEIDYCYMPAYSGSESNAILRSLSNKTPFNTQTVDTMINYAKANNQTNDVIWYTEVYSDRVLVNLLLLLIGKSTNTQSVFGNGHCTGGSSISSLITTGTMNTKGLFWGTNGTGSGVKVFGMEHWWGNQWRRIAGWICNKGNQKVKMTYGQSDGSTVDGYNLDGSGYKTIADSVPDGYGGAYISKMIFNNDGVVPKATTKGSATTYYCDVLFHNVERDNSYVAVGGSATNSTSLAMSVGAFNTYLFETNPSWSNGCAISCKPLMTGGAS